MALVPNGSVTDLLSELVQEARFPDAGFAHDEDHLSVSGLGFSEAVGKDRELPAAAEERCQSTFGLYVETASCRLSGEYLPRPDSLGLALQSLRAEQARVEKAFDQMVDGLGDRDLAGLGYLEEARGDIRRVA